jgi:hypothetical protein
MAHEKDKAKDTPHQGAIPDDDAALNQALSGTADKPAIIGAAEFDTAKPGAKNEPPFPLRLTLKLSGALGNGTRPRGTLIGTAKSDPRYAEAVDLGSLVLAELVDRRPAAQEWPWTEDEKKRILANPQLIAVEVVQPETHAAPVAVK